MREGAPARSLLASPGDPKRPIDGHALSVGMIRFGNALRAAKDNEGRGERGVETWTSERPSAHDLRRTLATRLAASGVPAEDVSACLNHARTSVTARHYDQYDRMREKRRALRQWAEQVAKLTGELNWSDRGTDARSRQVAGSNAHVRPRS
jgi:integrase